MYTKKPGRNVDQSGAGLEKRHKPKDPWKYIEPKDLQQPIIIDDKNGSSAGFVGAKRREKLASTNCHILTTPMTQTGGRKVMRRQFKILILLRCHQIVYLMGIHRCLTTIWCSQGSIVPLFLWISDLMPRGRGT